MSHTVNQLPDPEENPGYASPLQERHWFLHHYDTDPASQNRALVVEYRGTASAETLAGAFRRSVDRHPQLRQHFEAEPGALRVCPAAPGDGSSVRIARVDSEAALSQSLSDAQQRPIDLSSGATVTLDVIGLENGLWLCLVAHACVADDQSLRLLVAELARELGIGREASDSRVRPIAAPLPLPSREPAASQSSDEIEGYWLQRIGENPAPLELTTLGSRPTAKRYAASRSSLRLETTTMARLTAASHRLGCSTEALYLAAYLLTLKRWTAQETLVVGRQVDLRASSQDEIGPLTDAVPFRADFAAGTTLRSLVEQVESLLAEDRAHAGVGFKRLTQVLNVTRDPSRHPIYQAGFRLASTGTVAIRSTDQALLERPELAQPKTSCDIELRVECDAAEVVLTLLFDGALYEANAMGRFLTHYVNVLDRLDSDLATDIDRIELLDPEERRQILQIGHAPVAALDHSSVHEMFYRAAARHTDAPALVHGDRTLTYAELDALSNRIANLLRASSVGPGGCVGICMDRSIEMVATVLGVLKAGAAYVPMDPTYPEDRLRIMVEDSSATLVMAHRQHLSRLPTDGHVVAYEDLRSTLDAASENPPVQAANPEHLAYVIFTSGSTGRPKGVSMPHRSLVNLLEWQLERQPFIMQARVLQYTSLSFDVSFQEILSTFASGGTLYLIDDGERRDPRRLLDAITEQGIQRLFLPYVALRQLIEVAHATGRYPPGLEEVITAGEQLHVDDSLRAFFKRLPGTCLDNQYGPSETHVITAHMLTGDPDAWPSLPPIGRPIRNNQTLILDDYGSPVPLGVVGELYLAGTNVALGYVGRSDLTRERFLSSPLAAGPVYKTGDAARYRSDGTIDFLGRRDFQVKIRGHRIEPSEINNVLEQLPEIRQCLTKAIEDPRTGKRLVSYVLVEAQCRLDQEAAFRHARRKLPEYMVPSAIVTLTTFPFTPSGKVDMRALPVPEAPARGPRQITLPRTETESTLAEIWSALLQLKEVGTDESFFDVGGDSLLAVQLFLAIEQRLGVELPLALLAERPTIAGLASAIDGDRDQDLAGFLTLRRIQRGSADVTPLFLVHGGGGNVVLFGQLARAISPDLPVYAFEWDGWSGAPGTTSIEGMADLYVAELCRFRTSGPFRLGGHCIGGLIAMEMARRLRDLGHRVQDPLIVTDAPNLAAGSYHPTMPEAGTEAMKALREQQSRLEQALEACQTHADADREAFEPPPHHRSRPRRLLLRYLKRLHAMTRGGKLDAFSVNQNLDRLSLGLLRLLGRRVPLKHRALHASTSLVKAARNYRPTPYEGSVLYFRTRLFLGENLGLDGWWSDTCLGFDELCPNGMDVHYVKASHNGVVKHPRTAEVIRQVLGL